MQLCNYFLNFYGDVSAGQIPVHYVHSVIKLILILMWLIHCER